MAFCEEKLTECAAEFLKLAGNRMKYIHLIKLLYLLDREAVREIGLPVTTDCYVSTNHGPLLTKCLDFIKRPEMCPDGFWGKYIKTEPNTSDVLLVKIPPADYVSAWIQSKITAIFERYMTPESQDLIDRVHDNFSEWVDEGQSIRQITHEDVLRAVGHSEDKIQFFLAEQSCYDEMDRLIAKFSSICSQTQT